MEPGLAQYLAVAAILFGVGAYGALTRKNAIAVLMGVELMLNSACINFVAFWRFGNTHSMEALVFVLLGLTVAAAEAAVGLAVVLNVYRDFGTVDVDRVDGLRG